jgi:hypothetical protein
MNKDTSIAQANTWARTSDRQLEAYVREPENFHGGMRVAAVIYAVGRFDDYWDLDRGNWVYEWRRKTIRLRVTTQVDYVTEIALMDSTRAHPDSPLEILWQTTEPFAR